MRIADFAYSERFQAEFLRAPKEIQLAAKRALVLLLGNPQANSLRLHPLKSASKPMIWKVDVFPNHSWQITFTLRGNVAVLERIATHGEIDRRPR